MLVLMKLTTLQIRRKLAKLVNPHYVKTSNFGLGNLISRVEVPSYWISNYSTEIGDVSIYGKKKKKKITQMKVVENNISNVIL